MYNIWHVMKQRCGNPNNPNYKYYGGKGVKVCEEWEDFAKFAEWANANGYYEQGKVPHSQKLSIDRIDSNGDYCPDNCQWITMQENQAKMLKERWANERKSCTERSVRTEMAV